MIREIVDFVIGSALVAGIAAATFQMMLMSV